MITYDKHYQTLNLFGKPYKELLQFFKSYPTRGHILDLGCGQGRDAIALAKLGYEVTGVDYSKVGVDQMLVTSKKQGLKINGVTTDIYSIEIDEGIDFILLDSIIHFEKKEIKKEKTLLTRISKSLKKGGVICLCTRNTGKKVVMIKDYLMTLNRHWKILNDSMLTYVYHDKQSKTKSETKYNMLILKK